jgi:imidazolonepropionase-like amidohydrolase
MLKYIFHIILILGLGNAYAQVPAPAPPQANPIALVGGTAHVGNGTVIENAVVAFDQGKLTIVAAASSVTDAQLSGYDQVDVSGKHVYPGFILPNTDLGLVEIGAVRATVDNEETGGLNPNVRSIIAYNTDSEVIPTMRFNGILYAQVTPEGGRIPGRSSVVGLDAWNWEDAVVKADDAIHLNWPSKYTREYDYATFSVNRVPSKTYGDDVRAIKMLMDDAKAYLAKGASNNLKLDAMKGLFDGTTAMHLHTDAAQEIVEGIKVLKEYGVKNIALVGGEEAILVKDFIKEQGIPVVLSNVHRLPERVEDAVDLPYSMPSMLMKEGIDVALMYNGVTNARNLPFYAGTAAAYGLSKEEALQCITLNAAKIVGIDDVAGSLETGKHASLFVSAGDALDMRTNIMEHVFYQGRKLELEGIQQRLYQKYKKKYESQK